MAILVSALLVSAQTFGAYGLGLFVMTPFLIGVVTAYLANRQVLLGRGKTMKLVALALFLGALALVSLALEGVVCILMAAPLALLFAWPGAYLGRSIAAARQGPGKPLLSLAVLPALLALESVIPPSLAIDSHQAIEIAAPPEAVWKALTSDSPVAQPPGLVGRAGLAYPIRGRLLGTGRGATRIGFFSTGIARERIVEWAPGQRLGFIVLTQPPAMEEMSPYRRVHAPHVAGYFDTRQTRFDLEALPGGRTRLSLSATHVLRIDPIPYWEPIARWALVSNSDRVLEDIAAKAVAAS